MPQRLISDERLVALVRRGEPAAFERLYDRHVAELLSFCFFILGSREDAEDAVQSTFASAYRALLRDERAIELRPWLFAIARNACIGIVRKRRPQECEQLARIAGEDMLARVERRERIRELLAAMLELPERHRTALILAELHGHSQREIGQLLGVSPATVKSYIFQARSTLASERTAREADCHEIREELATARGAALLRGRLRRHLRSCVGCREYADQVSHRRHELGALLPLLPTLGLRRRVLDATAGKAGGASAAAGCAGAGVVTTGALELGGAGAKALLAKALIAITGLGAGAGAGTLALGVASSQPVQPIASRLDAASASRPARSPASPALRGSSPSGSYLGREPSGLVAPLSDQRTPAQPSVPGLHPVETVHRRASGAGSDAALAKTEAHRAQAPSGNGNGNANGHSSEHGNSAAAHRGSNGNAGGNSAEHAHGQGNGKGNAGGNGNAGRGNGGAKGRSGEVKTNGRGNGEAKGHEGGSAAQGNGHLGVAVHGAPGNSASDHGAPPAGFGGDGLAHGEAQGGANGAGAAPAGAPAAEREPHLPATEGHASAPVPASEHSRQGGAHEPQGAVEHGPQASQEPQGHGAAKL